MQVAGNPLVRLEYLRRFRGPGAAIGIMLALLIPAAAVSIAYATSTENADQVSFLDADRGFAGPEDFGAEEFGVPTTAVFGDEFGNPIPVDEFGNPLPSDEFGIPIGPAGGIRGGGIAGVDGPAVGAITGVGPGIFYAVSIALAVIVLVLVPSLVGGSIASERSNQTLQPLQVTRMTAGDIVVGKQLSSLAYLLLIVICAAPLLVVPYLLGGVSLGSIATVVILIILLAIEIAALSLMISSMISKPAGAIVVSMIATGALVIGPWIVLGLAEWARRASSNDVEGALWPIVALSPVSLASWMGRASEVTEGSGVSIGAHRLFSTILWVVVTVGCLLVARKRVTAPVAIDR